jgi:hypothetical protein
MPCHGYVRFDGTAPVANPALESPFVLKPETLVQPQRAEIALLRDELDACDVWMVACDLVEQPRKKLPPDSLSLRLGMNCDGKIAQDVREETQVAAVSVEFRGQTG